MILITRATDYAVRLLIALSAVPGERVKAADLAAATSLSEDCVLKVLTPLIRRGWIQSYRGPDGGFFLDPTRGINLLEVVELYEGPLHLQVCTGSKGCQFSARCPVHGVWLEAEMELRRVLSRHNIAEFALQSRRQGLFSPRN